MPLILEPHCPVDEPRLASAVLAAADTWPEPERILFASPILEDRLALRRILHPTYMVTTVRTCRDALERLSLRHIPVVFCDRELPDGTWSDMLTHLSSLPHQPLLVVASRAPDDRLWAEVLNLGGFDVIATPFDPLEARHVAAAATAYRRNPARPTTRAAGA